MTAKLKAEEIFNKMDMVVGGGNYDAKEYALIAVDEIIKYTFDENNVDTYILKEYLLDVKQEIEKL